MCVCKTTESKNPLVCSLLEIENKKLKKKNKNLRAAKDSAALERKNQKYTKAKL